MKCDTCKHYNPQYTRKQTGEVSTTPYCKQKRRGELKKWVNNNQYNPICYQPNSLIVVFDNLERKIERIYNIIKHTP